MTDILVAVEQLERLAAWHRLNAEHAGSSWVWEARLLTAEELERQIKLLRRRSDTGANYPGAAPP